MTCRVARRRGFTLVELLVVIAIIGILISLLLPAVQAAREAGRRTQCRDNLHNIGLALHLYHDTYARFPPGYDRAGSVTKAQSWSWSSFILPYLEQTLIHDQLGITAGGKFPFNATALTKTDLAIFNCPSDSDPVYFNNRKGLHGKSNYHGVLGNNQVRVNGNGVFFENSSISFGQITDGTSNTFAVGEVVLVPGTSGKKAALWAGMRGIIPRNGINYIHISDTIWWINRDPAWVINGTGEQAFSSNHLGGAQFVFCDGSVHYLHEGTSGITLEILAARNDGLQPGDY